jgi:hypothetical protein
MTDPQTAAENALGLEPGSLRVAFENGRKIAEARLTAASTSAPSKRTRVVAKSASPRKQKPA